MNNDRRRESLPSEVLQQRRGFKTWRRHNVLCGRSLVPQIPTPMTNPASNSISSLSSKAGLLSFKLRFCPRNWRALAEETRHGVGFYTLYSRCNNDCH